MQVTDDDDDGDKSVAASAALCVGGELLTPFICCCFFSMKIIDLILCKNMNVLHIRFCYVKYQPMYGHFQIQLN